MTIVGYVVPRFDQEAFTCPHCNCYSQHDWRKINTNKGFLENCSEWTTSCCLRCQRYCFWQSRALVWPPKSEIPDPVEDCPKEIAAIYNESREVFPHSVRASAALLRLAIQLICRAKGLPGKDLNADIGVLVSRGLSIEVQQSLDLLRVIGNNAVHPGQIVIEDNKEHVEKFFGLVNLIVDVLIVQPAKVNEMFSKLVPAEQQKQIASRDGKR